MTDKEKDRSEDAKPHRVKDQERVNIDRVHERRHEGRRKGDVSQPKQGHEETPFPAQLETNMKPASYLPPELILEVLAYLTPCRYSTEDILKASQTTLAVCARISHAWYAATTPLLYSSPHLAGWNYEKFVHTVCPSINAHVRASPLSSLVNVLDLSRLVHQGSKSMTARLLGRTKGSLEVFVAPQASFGVACLPPLAKCEKLRVLDLRIVSEAPPLPDLLRCASGLERLETFKLPRATGFGVHNEIRRRSNSSSGAVSPSSLSMPWPPALQALVLSGGIDAHFLHGVVAFPSTLHSLTIEHCPLAKGFAVTHLLKTAVQSLPVLRELKVSHMPRLGPHALDGTLALLPQLEKLSVGVEYVGPELFEGGYGDHRWTIPEDMEDANQVAPSSRDSFRHLRLRTLELTSATSSFTTSGLESMTHHPNGLSLSPIDIIIAMDNGALPGLRTVRVAMSLGWDVGDEAQETEALGDALLEACNRDSENGVQRGGRHIRPVVHERGNPRGIWNEEHGEYAGVVIMPG